MSGEALADRKAAARVLAAARREAAHAGDLGGAAGRLSEVLAGYRGVPLSGYLPIRSEIDPIPAMAEAAAHGAVGVPVITGPARPLKFSRWQPEAPLRKGPFNVMVPEVDDFIRPEILIIPLLAFDRRGGRLGYGGGFYDRTLELLRAQGPVLAIGFAYGAQESGDIPSETTDQPLDLIVTERDVIEPT
ncbi:5-formyltetrahydrofolate cyclo-ligase [Poseidonocella sedimentorum]|uniref:5-formyltetrahydrofolate cyclo-ligase n=1 Tax=Poseidonocella sedimentorum TaxID=871652 RepID=A0A1I6CQ70_9RHOB|nr:5-formyltetrahydrofolate cyclo-ligase [Poseidonocella sedimentorum]SFQ95310.1 5-formyltetrahydrofolate cyclo-ligase [Poseidonocella sedimentorum]